VEALTGTNEMAVPHHGHEMAVPHHGQGDGRANEVLRRKMMCCTRGCALAQILRMYVCIGARMCECPNMRMYSNVKFISVCVCVYIYIYIYIYIYMYIYIHTHKYVCRQVYFSYRDHEPQPSVRMISQTN
jgi:hypothetical protein